MPSPRSPSMPTKRQVEDAFEVAHELCHGARIKGIGPEGVTFDYPKEKSDDSEWCRKPFSGDVP